MQVYTYITPTVIFCDQDSYVMKFNLEMDTTVFKVRCISNKIWTQITPFFYLLGLIMCESVGRSASCIRVSSASKYIFNNDAYFLDFGAQKFPLVFFNLNTF